MSDKIDRDSIWRIRDEQVLHDSPWMKLTVATVDLPNGKSIEHRIVRYPHPTAGLLVHDRTTQSVLLMWRHRFITDHWGWEIPAGMIDDQESPADAALRECREETGYIGKSADLVIRFDTSSGLMDEEFYGFYCSESRQSETAHDFEASRLSWVPVDELDGLIDNGQIVHGHTLITIAIALRKGLLDRRT
jgi:8-oxo-dGTP pyrophosphatase MutT (NUDIX family)